MQQPWLDPVEQEDVCRKLLQYGLIKFSNGRDLPLKSGGKTDIYINLRDARNHAEAIKVIVRAYENPLRRLGIDRFAEVPDSVSCFAGSLLARTGIPYFTIREQPKVGRVAKAKIIGSPNFGERVAILDDVITDGESKIVSYQECRAMGLDVASLVVLVDRQQGWREKFAARGIPVNVWPGMTLHDVRRHLIRTIGVMERCSKDVEERNPIIVALDGKSWDEVLPFLDQLRTLGCIFKVNDLLFDQGIERLIPNLHVYGRVMADIKGHDIPNTLKNISKHFLHDPPWAVTVHASGASDMIKAVVGKLEGTPTKVLAVTVLTTFDRKTCRDVYSRLPIDQVRRLAKIAVQAGAHGFVCSPEETKMLRKAHPGKIIVNPGIRSEGVDKGDQRRVSTPKGAIENGAHNIVMGRQVFEAPDPVAEVRRVLKDELGIAV